LISYFDKFCYIIKVLKPSSQLWFAEKPLLFHNLRGYFLRIQKQKKKKSWFHLLSFEILDVFLWIFNIFFNITRWALDNVLTMLFVHFPYIIEVILRLFQSRKMTLIGSFYVNSKQVKWPWVIFPEKKNPNFFINL
jgi:hypothetical protein